MAQDRNPSGIWNRAAQQPDGAGDVSPEGQADNEPGCSNAGDAALDAMAAGLYNMASMLVGEGEDSVRLVENAISETEISACSDADAARSSCTRALCRAAIERINERDPGSLDAPEWLEHAATCIEDDDLESAGISRAELESMLSGPHRQSVRTWIESLATETRVIFVLRAVAGLNAEQTAAMISLPGRKDRWSAEAVREIFRQGLCSLASQLIHAASR